MQLRDELEARIRRPVATARDAAAVRHAAELLEELLRLEDRAREVGPGTEPDGARDGDLRGLPLHLAAEKVLEQAGVPLHVKELGARIKAGGWRHPRSTRAQPRQILFQLAARLPQHPETFRRVAPNTFGLTRWGTSGGDPERHRPKTGLFRGPGDAVGRAAGETAPVVTDPDSAWRSS